MREGHVLAVAAAALLAVPACTRAGAGAGGERPPVAVEVASASRAPMTQTIAVVGSLEPKFVADVKSEFTGVVAEVFVTQWVRVERGTPLARLDTREADAAVGAAQALAAQADVAAARASRELDRAVKLKEHGLVTQQNLDDARSAAEAAAAAARAAAAELAAAETRRAKAVIRAPMAGVVALREVSAGDRVESMGGGPMFRIVDNRVLELTVPVPSARSEAVRPGQRIDFTVDAWPGRVFSAQVMHVNPAVDPVSRTVGVMAEVGNGDGALRGGTFVQGLIAVGERRDVLQVPRVALLSWDVEHGGGEVFVVSGGTAARRAVRTGETAADTVEVVEGLTAGELVVTRGAFNLRPGDRVTIAPAPGV